MKNLKDIIIEKLKINSKSSVEYEFDTFKNFVETHGGKFSKANITNDDEIICDNAKLFDGVKKLVSLSNDEWENTYKDKILKGSSNEKFEYDINRPQVGNALNILCKRKSSGQVVSVLCISIKDSKVKLSYNIGNAFDESIEQTYVNIILKNILNV